MKITLDIRVNFFFPMKFTNVLQYGCIAFIMKDKLVRETVS